MVEALGNDFFEEALQDGDVEVTVFPNNTEDEQPEVVVG